MQAALRTERNGSAGLPALAYAFRPFFLLGSIYAIVLMAAWMGVWFAGWPLAGQLSPLAWHGHEMLFGLMPAIVAGFLLTAMCNWTGHRPLSGSRLLALVLFWLAGRLAMWSGAWLPGGLIAVVDSAFLLVLAIYVGYVIISHGSRRNLLIVMVLTLYWLASLAAHANYLGWTHTPNGQELALMLVVTLMAVIGGRITPAFTRNWLRRQGKPEHVVISRAWLEASALVSLLTLVIVLVLPAPPFVVVALAFLAGGLHGLRLLGWAGWVGWREPLIWILHLGYAWLVIGLLLKGAGLLSVGMTSSLWIHALGVGAMGTLILGVMTRVCLGHTGRALELPAGGLLIYGLITVAAGARLTYAAHWLPEPWVLALSALAWVGAFGVFLMIYTPILIAPRADGRPG